MRHELHVEGQPVLSHSSHAEEDVTRQAERVFESMGDILRAGGATFADVVKLTIFLTDVDERPRIAALREQVFGVARPASTLVGGSGLAVSGARIEVECIAVLPS